MEYSKIISVTGLSGLFELLSSKADGAIVRSLDDKSSRFVSSRIHNFSHLESIEIFTVNENVNLAEVFIAIQNSSVALPNEKDNSEIKKYFETVYPDMDFEKVYLSDMKKILKWMGILKANNIEIKAPQPEEEVADSAKNDAEETLTKPAEDVPASPKEKKAKAGEKTKPSAKKEVPASEENTTPKKKSAPGKKAKE